MTGYRIMMYCQDSLGLGHLRRSTNIAWGVHRLAPQTEILIVADSPVAPFFPIPPNCDVVKLPTIVKVDAGEWKSPLDTVLDLDQVRALRVELLRSIADEFRPDAILVDHLAHGALGELVPTIDAIRQRNGVHLVLGLRDILGDPEAIRSQWDQGGVPDLITSSYDQILVYGAQEIFDLPAMHQFSPAMADKTTFCGYVVQAVEPSPSMREDGSIEVLVMAGGGHDGDRIMTATVDALEHLEDKNLHFTIMTGPFLSPERSEALRRTAAGYQVDFEPPRALSLTDLEAADLVVSMCGYNTMSEVLKLQKPAVVVPRLGPSLEQTIRARLFAERGLIHAVANEEIAPDHFARCLQAELDRTAESRSIVPTNGDDVAAAALLQREPLGLAI